MLFDSKLPDVGTTIFTIMSRRALDEGALNIGQGFPDYPIDPRLADLVAEGGCDEGHDDDDFDRNMESAEDRFELWIAVRVWSRLV